MTRSENGADWFFDFISPFAYLQLQRLGELPVAGLQLRPVLFAGLLRHWGQLGPAELPTKRSFTYRHTLWQARSAGVAMRFPPAHPFNPLSALRLAIACGVTREAVQTIFSFIWRDGRDPDGEWAHLCQALGLDAEEARARIAQPQVKEQLKADTDAAIASGVFGVPTLVLDGQLFWGADATDMALDWLEDPRRFEDAEMRRMWDIPAAVQRPRS
jgi:2-hydroxychromene-2-carboxylate isomerase